jgi:hypothetical protein
MARKGNPSPSASADSTANNFLVLRWKCIINRPVAFDAQEQEQIRTIIHDEVVKQRNGLLNSITLRTFLILVVFPFCAFCAVLALHVLVIGAITIYHLTAK